MVVDTLGLLVVVLVTAASLQDRDGGRLVLARARIAMPSILIKELKTPYTIVIVTHNMQQAARVSDHTGFFTLSGAGQPGRLVEFDDTEKIFSTLGRRSPSTTSPDDSASRQKALPCRRCAVGRA